MSDHRCNGHETEALREFLFVEFVSAYLYEIWISNRRCTSKPVLLKLYFFSAVEDSNFPCFQPHTQENSNRLNTFSTSHSVVFIIVRIVFEFNSYIFSDLFPLFNMLATTITSEPSRQARERIRNQACYETNKDALKNKKVRFHFKIKK